MKTLRDIRIACLVVVSATLLPSLPVFGQRPERTKVGALVVVVSKDSPRTDISLAELRQVFRRDTQSASTIPLNLRPHSDERVAFDKLLLGLQAEAVGKFWVDQKIRGRPGPPKVIPSVAMLLKVVARFPQTLGYVPEDRVTPGVRVLKIDGMLPSDPKYPLRRAGSGDS